MGIAFAPWALTACKATITAGILLSAVAIRHRLYYDFSLINTVWTQDQWWHHISPDIVLGAIPLIHHVNQLKAEGITHVITLLEDFELERGIVHPATTKLWQQYGIAHFHKRVKDFEAVPIETIRDVIRHMQDIRRENLRAKFYIHCKAGRGRSATIVIADRLSPQLNNQQHTELEDLINQEIQSVKAIRKRVNLNAGQRASIFAYCEDRLRN
jgi:atypical dual specificity phosphatase